MLGEITMTEYKKICFLEEEVLNHIKVLEKPNIMQRINQTPRIRISFQALVKYSMIPLTLIVIVITLLLVWKPSTTGEFTIENVKEKLVIYEERLTELALEEEVIELNFFQNARILELSDENLYTYTRDELFDVYSNHLHDVIEEDYHVQLIKTKAYVEYILELLEGNEDIPLGEVFYPDEEDLELTFKFIMNSEDYVVIETTGYFEMDNEVRAETELKQFYYIKIGMVDGLLEYYDIHYRYNIFAEDLTNENALEYRYFRFNEQVDATYVISQENLYSLRYTSIETGKQFEISYGSQIAEGPVMGELSYVLNIYNPETRSRAYMDVVNGEITSSTYDVFDEHSLLYRYEDTDIFDEQIKLSTNIVSATGWDYVIVSDGVDDESDAVTGIYLDGGIKLYSGRLGYTYTDTYAAIMVKQFLDKDDLTEEVMNLSSIGLTCTSEQLTLDSLHEVIIEDFDDIRDEFNIEGFNLETDNLQLELYNFLDQDIRDSIEGVNEPDNPDTTGDIEVFQAILDQFNEANVDKHQLTVRDTTTVNIYDGEDVVGTTSIVSDTSCDLEDYYYREIVTFLGSPEQMEYIVVEVDGKLVAFTIDPPIADFEVIAQQATLDNYLELIEFNLFDEHSTDDFIAVEQVGDLEFRVTLSPNIFGDGINVTVLFEQQGILGIDEAEIIAVYTFDEDYSGYNLSLEVTGLSSDGEEDYDIIMSSSVTVNFTTITKINPFTRTQYFYLPQSKQDIIFTTPLESLNRYYLHDGSDSWIRYELDAGEYSVNVNGQFTSVEHVILDEAGNVVPEEYRFTIEESGTYYIKVTTPYQQSIDVTVYSNPSPIGNDIVLDQESDTVLINRENELQEYTIIIPAQTEDNILEIEMLEPDLSDSGGDIEFLDEENAYIMGVSCNYTNGVRFCYLNIPKETEISLRVMAYYIGQFGFHYRFISQAVLETSETEITITDINQLPNIILTTEHPEVKLNFTITEDGYYKLLDTIYNQNWVNVEYALYESLGNLITYFWNIQYTELSLGDYYVIINLDNPGDGITIVIPTFYKQP